MGLDGNKVKIVGIIQCRTGSKRLPDKALMSLAGRPMLWRYIERCKRIEMLDELVLATTELYRDNVLCDIAELLNIKWFRGSEDDLVDRIYQCAIKHKADVIVRLCADNPLIEPEEADRIIKYFLERSYTVIPSLISNTQNLKSNNYPDGIGCEIYDIDSFKWTFNGDREHPHSKFYQRGWIETIPCPKEFAYPQIKLDVNTKKEYEYVKKIYDHFGHNNFHVTDYIRGLL